MGAENHVAHHGDHDEAQNLGETVHGRSHLLAEEEEDGDDGADGGSHGQGNAAEDVQPHGRSADVADVEDESADGDGEGEEVAQAGQNPVGHILGPHARYGQNAPYVELDDDVDENRRQDGEGEGGLKFFREDGRLSEKARSDGRRGHEEGRPQKHAEGVLPACLFRFLQSRPFQCECLPVLCHANHLRMRV